MVLIHQKSIKFLLHPDLVLGSKIQRPVRSLQSCRWKGPTRKYKYKAVSRKKVYGKLGQLWEISDNICCNLRFLNLKCWEKIPSPFSLIISSHRSSQISHYSTANLNPSTDFQGSTGPSHPQKVLKQMQEEAHQVINFHLNFHYVDSIFEGKGHTRALWMPKGEWGCWLRVFWIG